MDAESDAGLAHVDAAGFDAGPPPWWWVEPGFCEPPDPIDLIDPIDPLEPMVLQPWHVLTGRVVQFGDADGDGRLEVYHYIDHVEDIRRAATGWVVAASEFVEEPEPGFVQRAIGRTSCRGPSSTSPVTGRRR